VDETIQACFGLTFGSSNSTPKNVTIILWTEHSIIYESKQKSSYNQRLVNIVWSLMCAHTKLF